MNTKDQLAIEYDYYLQRSSESQNNVQEKTDIVAEIQSRKDNLTELLIDKLKNLKAAKKAS